jgi:hypothetical protein
MYIFIAVRLVPKSRSEAELFFPPRPKSSYEAVSLRTVNDVVAVAVNIQGVDVFLDGCKTLITTLLIQVIQLIRAPSEATVEPRRSVLLYTNLLAAPRSLRNWLILHVRPSWARDRVPRTRGSEMGGRFRRVPWHRTRP